MKFVFYVLFAVISLSMWTIFYYGQNALTQEATTSAVDWQPHEAPRKSERGQKPLLILHAGPGKTGTTTIQWFAEENGAMLQEDNIYYLVQERHALARTCRSESLQNECHAKWKEFHDLLEYHYEEGHDVFVSEEGFSAWDDEETEQAYVWDQFEPLKEHWRIRVIYAYRRYYEWLPSKYAQAYNPKAVGNQRDLWPNDGGTRIPSFPDYYEKKQKRPFKHPHAYKKRWEQRFNSEDSSVEIFNMHMTGDLLSNFYCTMIPEAKSVCNHLTAAAKSKNSTETTVTLNPSSDKTLHYDMIAVEAYNRNWLPPGSQRAQVRRVVKEHATKDLKMTESKQFPMQCLSSKDTSALLEQSIEMEKEMIPNDHSKDELEELFQEAVHNKLFCSVHVDKILTYKWEYFFRSLNLDDVNKMLDKEKKNKKKKIA